MNYLGGFYLLLSSSPRVQRKNIGNCFSEYSPVLDEEWSERAEMISGALGKLQVNISVAHSGSMTHRTATAHSSLVALRVVWWHRVPMQVAWWHAEWLSTVDIPSWAHSSLLCPCALI